MATLDERFEAAATKAENASKIGREWANGDATTTITTESGPLPSLAKFLDTNQTSIDNFVNNNQTTLDRVNAMQKLVDNTVVRLKFDTDEGHQHNDLSVTRGNATSLINYTCSTTATGQTADGRIVEVAPDTPRIVWNNGKAVGLLNEPSSENLLLNSEDYSQPNWTKITSTQVSVSTVDSPIIRNGSAIPFQRLEAGVTASGEAVAIRTSGVQFSDRFSAQAIFKPDELPYLMFRLNSDKNTHVIVDPVNNTVDTSDFTGDVVIEELRDGSYFISITDSGHGTSTGNVSYWCKDVFDLSVSGSSLTAGDGAFLIATQAEPGYPTSYIPTTTSSVVRGDTLTEILTSIKNSKNTYYTEFILGAFNSAETVYVMNESSGGFDNRMSIRRVTENNFRFIGAANEVGLGVDNFVSIPAGSLVKLAVVFDGSQVKVFINGSFINAASFDVPSGLDRLQIGQEQGGNIMNTTFSNSILSGTALTDAEAIALTTLES